MIPPFSILNEYFHPLVFNKFANHVLVFYNLLRCPFLQTRKSCASHMLPSASQKHLLVNKYRKTNASFAVACFSLYLLHFTTKGAFLLGSFSKDL